MKNKEFPWVIESSIAFKLINLDYIKKYEIINVIKDTNLNVLYSTIIYIDVIIDFALYMADVLITSKKLNDIKIFGKDIKIVYNIIYEKVR